MLTVLYIHYFIFVLHQFIKCEYSKYFSSSNGKQVINFYKNGYLVGKLNKVQKANKNTKNATSHKKDVTN